jgi:galactose-1-phosphate uridylyltransferase
MTDEERDAVADLVHACHIAAGPHTPSNEEWLHRPLDVDVPMPWRIVIKWRGHPAGRGSRAARRST